MLTQPEADHLFKIEKISKQPGDRIFDYPSGGRTKKAWFLFLIPTNF